MTTPANELGSAERSMTCTAFADDDGGPGGEPRHARTIRSALTATRGAWARLTQGFAGVTIHRLLISLPMFFVATALSFALVSLAPGDPAAEILGADATVSALEALREQLGLNDPLWQRYWDWLAGVTQGDLGTSLVSSAPVSDLIAQRVPVTLSLIVAALLVSLVAGVAMGVFSAVRGGAPGRFVDGLSMIGFAFPSFWVGAVLIGIFAVRLGWFAASGYVPISESPVEWLRSIALPTIALSLYPTAAVAKQTREAMLEILGSEFVRMARANGVSETSIIFRHGLKNAGIRVVTILGLVVIGLLGGTVLVETVFALPGLGGLVVQASLRQDLPVLQGVVLLFTLMVIAINLIVDLTYAALNPRVAAG